MTASEPSRSRTVVADNFESPAVLLDELRFNGRAHFTLPFRHALADRLQNAIAADFERLRAIDAAEIRKLREKAGELAIARSNDIAEISRLRGEVEGLAGARDTLIVAANNPVSHGGVDGLRRIMLEQARRIGEALRAADNRDAAGVCDCPGIGKADKTLHAPNCPVRTAPAAVPAGEAVAWVEVGQFCLGRPEEWELRSSQREAEDQPIYTRPPAPVQAAPQEGEVQAVKIGYIDPRNLWLIQESRHAGLWQNCIKGEGAQGEKDVPLYAYAAHPSACELGRCGSCTNAKFAPRPMIGQGAENPDGPL